MSTVTTNQHTDLATGRWHTMTLCEQMGNIGSEVSRALSWKQKGNMEQSWRACARALELFVLTQTDSRYSGEQGREIARSKEVFLDFFAGDNEYHSTDHTIQSYFDAFARVARRSI